MSARLSPSGIRLLVSDVDGTLVTNDKRLTPGVQNAARAVERAGMGFAITSSRPAFGMRMLIEPLQITTPIAAFNGGLIVSPDRLQPIEGNAVPVEVARRSIEFLGGRGVAIWLHTETDWFVLDASGILQVSARDAQTGAEQRASLDVIGAMPESDVAASRERLHAMRR